MLSMLDTGIQKLMCRTFGSVIEVLFPICSLARGKVLLETMSYLTVFDCRYGFRSTSKVILLDPRSTKLTLQVGLCQTYGFFNQTRRFPCAPFDGKKGCLSGIYLVRDKSLFLFGYRKGQIDRKCQGSFSVANSEIRWSQLVPSTTVLTLSVQTV